VIAVAIQALLNAGLKKFYIDIGSARFFNSVMEQLPLMPEHKKVLRKSIMNKDFVLLEKLLIRYQLSEQNQNVILQLPHWRGDESVIEDAEKTFGKNNEIARTSLREIKDIYQYLKAYGFEKYILIDLGIIRNFDYYTGIVFEGYTGYMGSAICGGGRYDHLCQKFGKDIPSTGVAIGIERLLRVLAQENRINKEELNERKYFIRYQESLIKTAFQLAERLRKSNNIVEMELRVERPKKRAIQYSLKKKIRYLIDIQSENLNSVIRYDLQTNKEERMPYEKN
ncbi:MAG: ATP phosphoribosyltransferase regulatory subunit, partial [Elusimicrobiota bacterium]